jgi:hypothetical protein
MSLNNLRPLIIAAICLLLIHTSHADQTPQHHTSGGFTQPEPIDFNDHEGWTQIFDGKTLHGWDVSTQKYQLAKALCPKIERFFNTCFVKPITIVS